MKFLVFSATFLAAVTVASAQPAPPKAPKLKRVQFTVTSEAFGAPVATVLTVEASGVTWRKNGEPPIQGTPNQADIRRLSRAVRLLKLGSLPAQVSPPLSSTASLPLIAIAPSQFKIVVEGFSGPLVGKTEGTLDRILPHYRAQLQPTLDALAQIRSRLLAAPTPGSKRTLVGVVDLSGPIIAVRDREGQRVRMIHTAPSVQLRGLGGLVVGLRGGRSGDIFSASAFVPPTRLWGTLLRDGAGFKLALNELSAGSSAATFLSLEGPLARSFGFFEGQGVVLRGYREGTKVFVSSMDGYSDRSVDVRRGRALNRKLTTLPRATGLQIVGQSRSGRSLKVRVRGNDLSGWRWGYVPRDAVRLTPPLGLGFGEPTAGAHVAGHSSAPSPSPASAGLNSALNRIR